MNEQEQQIADELYAAIQAASSRSDRSLQSAEFQAGVSDLGFCSERTRRMIDHQVPEESDLLTAWIGTALGDHAERAAESAWPHAIRQARVAVRLDGEQRSYVLTGHPDLLVDNKVIDIKTDYGLSTVERSGPSLQQQFQRHCYAKGAYAAGLLTGPLEEVQVANAWIDRAAIDKRIHVQMEPYDEAYVEQAGAWLDDVVYAYLNGEEARKEPPREMCAVVCGFFKVCRAYDTDVEGLLTDPSVVASAAMYREGLDLEKAGKRLKDQAKVHLEGIRGSTGEYLIRWTHINESVVPESTRRGYDKLEVKPLPKPKAGK